MERQDYNLPFMLTYENIAWFYEEGYVKILDRRIYPEKVEFVTCNKFEEVAQAVADMVTQSAGPYTAVGMGMALAAFECKDLSKEEQIKYLENASYVLSHARPTTANRMEKITKGCLEVAKVAINNNENVALAIKNETINSLNRRYSIMEKVGKNLSKQIKDGDRILTQCFGETIIGMLTRLLKEEKKENVKIYCAETRPYYQGARLTATCFAEMGFDTTILTDNMIAYAMKYEKINVFTSAADTITRGGYIANKIGTYQIALLAKEFGVPYYVTGIPDVDKFGENDITIEMRDPALVLGNHTHEKSKAIYPSFDITPPYLISGIVTDNGIYSAFDLESYFENEVKRFY
ncbi:s-methyl-5-thioribose-1-phosphate isomerase [Streptobacillus canis]|uniref:s-methyl-5-thioribose-1-phosphate isomerase n=1 Tax=Streptobacillus canis TaxID=2678686 RepID=UPI0012E19DFA|nr:s-methyl-5-thioribose-1-phosphate isomerase [Streptobacillus canis]